MRRLTLREGLFGWALLTALLWRAAAPTGSPPAVVCESPVRVHDVLVCARDGTEAPRGLEAAACTARAEAGSQLWCTRDGVRRTPMRPAELAALQVRLPLNDAPAVTLESIRGVGPVLAQRISDERPFERVLDVTRVRGVGPTKAATIAARTCIECDPPRAFHF